MEFFASYNEDDVHIEQKKEQGRCEESEKNTCNIKNELHGERYEIHDMHNEQQNAQRDKLQLQNRNENMEHPDIAVSNDSSTFNTLNNKADSLFSTYSDYHHTDPKDSSQKDFTPVTSQQSSLYPIQSSQINYEDSVEHFVGANLLNHSVVGKVAKVNMNDIVFQREYHCQSRKRKRKDSEPSSMKDLSSTQEHIISEEEANGFPQRAFILDEDKQIALEKERTQQEEQELRESKRMRIESLKAMSEFHVDKRKDYKGKTFIHPPSWVKTMKQVKCYEPKKLTHTYEGHTKGVNTIALFPRFGHLLLSGSYDGTVKIWDVLSHRKCIITFLGHQKGISDLCFRSDGRQFLSSSFDNTTLLWDTEKGKVVSTFRMSSIPHCCRFHPHQDRNHQFLTGLHNKQICQWDARSHQVVLTYEQHKGPVKNIEFLRGKNGACSTFASTSDDKTLRIWHFTHKGKGVPVEIKKVEDPNNVGFHYMKQHPTESSFLVSGYNSTISLYHENHPLYSYDKNRVYRHSQPKRPVVACGIDVSQDGKFVLGGDADGRVHIWNTERKGGPRSFTAHQGACKMIQWHPTESSKLLTCGSEDGLIKIWE